MHAVSAETFPWTAALVCFVRFFVGLSRLLVRPVGFIIPPEFYCLIRRKFPQRHMCTTNHLVTHSTTENISLFSQASFVKKSPPYHLKKEERKATQRE